MNVIKNILTEQNSDGLRSNHGQTDHAWLFSKLENGWRYVSLSGKKLLSKISRTNPASKYSYNVESWDGDIPWHGESHIESQSRLR